MSNPIDILPIEHPIRVDPSVGELDYFYENVSKHLIEDVIKIMGNGIPIDLTKVAELETTVTNVLEDVTTRLASNSVIQDFQAFMYPKKFKAFKDELELRKRPISYYIKEYKGTIPHRTYVVNAYLESIDSPHAGKDRWTVKDLKGLNIILKDPIIASVIADDALQHILDAGMLAMAKAKLEVYNRSIDTKVVDEGTQVNLLPPFNCGSNKQLRELFEYLEIEPIRFSETSGEASWSRDAIEELQVTVDKSSVEIQEILQLIVDHSFSAIIKNNFIAAFKKFTIDGVLYGNIKLFGAKSFRLTSSSPNMLNQPSSGSIYAKPLKECFIAPKGKTIIAVDLDQLEDRVIANLSGDKNKISIFTEGLDSHCLAATYYFKDKLTPMIGDYTDHKEASKKFKTLVQEGNKAGKEIRQNSKPVTFGLSYGAFPAKVASSIKCGIEEATGIFNSYHNELFPEITTFRENVEATTKVKGYTHLGLGCRLYSGDVSKEVRSLFNANSQFWSIITLLTINKMHSLIDLHKKDVVVSATIYDSIYMVASNDAETIKWVNDNIIPILTTPIFVDEVVHNTAAIEIGPNWANLTEVPNNASLKEIEDLMAY